MPCITGHMHTFFVFSSATTHFMLYGHGHLLISHGYFSRLCTLVYACVQLLTVRPAVFILCSVPTVSLLLWDVLLPLYTLCLAPDLVVSCSPLGLSCALTFVPCCILYRVLFIPFPITLVPCSLPIFQCSLCLVSYCVWAAQRVAKECITYIVHAVISKYKPCCDADSKNFLVWKFLEVGQRPLSSSIITTVAHSMFW